MFDKLLLSTFIVLSLRLVRGSYEDFMEEADVSPLSVSQTNRGSVQITTLMFGKDICDRPSDCREAQRCGANRSGVYKIYPWHIAWGNGFKVYCDMTSHGGGWLVFHRRQDGSVNFYRNWQEYVDGFGNLLGEFWLGLEKLHVMTSQQRYELLIQLGTYTNGSRYAKYDRFYVSPQSEAFRLLLGTYSGDAGNALGSSNGQKFTTKDRDNDSYKENCAVHFEGAWWYLACHHANLNGAYQNRGSGKAPKSMTWYHITSAYEPLQYASMMVRPVT